MPRNYIKKTNRSQIDENNMKKAIKECLKKTLTMNEAARQYGIKRTTLQSRMKTILQKKPIDAIVNSDSGNESDDNLAPKYGNKYTSRQVFTSEQENQLKDYIKRSSDLHYGLSYRQTRLLAYQYIKLIPNAAVPELWESKQIAGKEWMLSFMKRHTDLSLRKPESTSFNRSIGFNKGVVDDFFEKYVSVIQKHNLAAHQIYNLDETGVTTVMKPIKVLSTKGKKQVGQIASGERGALVTCTCIINAIGTVVPPVFLYPRIRAPSEYLNEGSPQGSIALGNKSGWMTAELFPDVLKHLKNFTHCSTESKILLLLDNHESHISVEAIKFCKSNGIILLSFPPHTSHRLQPLDVGVYGPLKTYLARASDDWLLTHPGQVVTLRTISYLVNKAYEHAFTIKNIVNSFAKPGLWPINRLAFTEQDFVASSVVSESLSASPIETNGIAVNNEQPSCSNASVDMNRNHQNQHINKQTAETCSRSEPKLSEMIPFAKAPAKKKKTNSRSCKSTIYTDTPEIMIRENIELERKRKKDLKNKTQVTRKIFNTENTKKPPKKIFEDSSSSDSDVSVLSRSSDGIGEEAKELDMVVDQDIYIDDFLLVAFPTKTLVVHYVGIVQKHDFPLYTVKFLRRKGDSSTFFYPNVEDITEINFGDILAKLEAPTRTGTVRTSSVLTFNYNFNHLTVH